MSDTTDPQVGAALLQALRSEKDASSLQMIAGILAQNPPPGAADAILDAIANQKNKQARQVLIWSLGQMQGDDATRAITTLAAAESDPATKSQLDLALRVRASPVAGYFVAYVQPQSDAEQAGIKPGDVITTLQGQPVKNWQQLQGATGQTEDDKPFALVVYRDGQTFNVQLAGGKTFWETGVSGDFAKGQAR
jgi:S1-C subfamily serine protease